MSEDAIKYKVIVAVPGEAENEAEAIDLIKKAVIKSYQTHPWHKPEDFNGTSVLLLNRYDIFSSKNNSHNLECAYPLKEIVNSFSPEDASAEIHVHGVVLPYYENSNDPLMEFFKIQYAKELSDWDAGK